MLLLIGGDVSLRRGTNYAQNSRRLTLGASTITKLQLKPSFCSQTARPEVHSSSASARPEQTVLQLAKCPHRRLFLLDLDPSVRRWTWWAREAEEEMIVNAEREQED